MSPLPDSVMPTFAFAVPWPRASRAFAVIRAWCADGSLSTISTSPRYCIDTGPTFTLMPTL